ncbi:MAG: hypothetical protein U9R55_04850 [Pseudomonadota bacterium]|nr:hypothetical protein [Pseudomonadota bacterium]
MLKHITGLAIVLLVALPVAAQPASDPAEVDAVVAAMKAANPDFKSLCQKGPDGIRKASTEAVMGLMASGKVKGNPQALGGEAGQKVGRECRGG